MRLSVARERSSLQQRAAIEEGITYLCVENMTFCLVTFMKRYSLANFSKLLDGASLVHERVITMRIFVQRTRSPRDTRNAILRRYRNDEPIPVPKQMLRKTWGLR